MAFADNIYYLRKKAGISQEELAERLGVSRQAVSKWETGDAYPETDKIIALCDMYGVTMDELVRGDVTKENAAKEDVTKEDGVPIVQPAAESRAGDIQQQTTADEQYTPAYAATNEEEDEQDDVKNTNPAQPVVQSLLWVLAAVVYLVLGIFFNLWHPGWILFIIMPAVTCGVEIIFAPKGKRLKKVLAFIESLAIFGSVCTYLLSGFLFGWWGTMWVIFLLIPITIAICDIFKPKKKDK